MKQDKMEELKLPEGFRKLFQRLRRGQIIFYSLSIIFLACTCAALIFHWGISWVITAFIMTLVCRLTLILSIGPRYIAACKVAENPQIVYWAHYINGRGQAVQEAVLDSKSIRLHLKDGTQFAVDAVRGTGTSPEQLQEVVSWLHQRNPEMRWGDYDNTRL